MEGNTGFVWDTINTISVITSLAASAISSIHAELPLMNAAKEELERMVELGMIRVQVSNRVVCRHGCGPQSGWQETYMCGFHKLNENVCRELHMLPCVEQILAQLSGVKVFTKLWLMVNQVVEVIVTTYNFHNSIWEIFLSKISSHLGSLLHQRYSRSECLKFFLVLMMEMCV